MESERVQNMIKQLTNVAGAVVCMDGSHYSTLVRRRETILCEEHQKKSMVTPTRLGADSVD